MDYRTKTEIFQNEIRRKQRNSNVHEMRTKTKQMFEERLNEQISEAKYKLQFFIENKNQIIDVDCIRYFEHLVFDSELICQKINNCLKPSSLRNILFVTLCAQILGFDTNQFFQKFTQNLQCDKFSIYQWSSIKNINYKRINCPQQVCLNYVDVHFKNNSPKNKISNSMIQKIKKLFISYWNDNIQKQQVNFVLSCKIILHFLNFGYKNKIHNDFLENALKGIIYVIVEEDNSDQKWFLLSTILKYHQNIGIILANNEKWDWEQIFYKGLDSTKSLDSTIVVIDVIISNEKYLPFVENHMLKILHKLYKNYFQEEMCESQLKIIFTFHNIIVKELQNLQEFYKKIQFEQMLINLRNPNINIHHFLDFCLIVISEWTEQSIVDSIFQGNTLKMIDLSNSIIFTQNNGNVWYHAEQLFVCLQKIFLQEIQIFQIRFKLQKIIQKLQIVILMNDDEKNVNNSQMKNEQIIQNYVKLLKKIEQQSK